jgi:hypothetical protein
MRRRTLLTARAIALFAVGSLASSGLSEGILASDQIRPAATEAPAGSYMLDRSHASLIFRVDHLGFSRYTARFTRFDAELHFDPANPAASSVTATIDSRSIETDHPDPTYDFDAQLRTEPWLNTAQIAVTAFADSEQPFPAAGCVLARGETEPGGKAPAIVKGLRVDDGRHHRCRDHRADTRDCGQPPGSLVAASLVL